MATATLVATSTPTRHQAPLARPSRRPASQHRRQSAARELPTSLNDTVRPDRHLPFADTRPQNTQWTAAGEIRLLSSFAPQAGTCAMARRSTSLNTTPCTRCWERSTEETGKPPSNCRTFDPTCPWGREQAGLTSRAVGQQFGVAQVSLTTNQIPTHSHGLVASTSLATAAQATGLVPAQSGPILLCPQPVAGANPQTMAPASVTVAATASRTTTSCPANDEYIIALYGIYLQELDSTMDAFIGEIRQFPFNSPQELARNGQLLASVNPLFSIINSMATNHNSACPTEPCRHRSRPAAVLEHRLHGRH